MPLSIYITWNKNTDDTVEYGVWRRTATTEPSEIARVAQPGDASDPEFSDGDVDISSPTGPTGLTVNRPTTSEANLNWTAAADPDNPTYYYSIRAYDANNNHSPLSPEASLTPSNIIDQYEWELVDEADGTVVNSGTVAGDSLSTPDVAVTSGTTYHFNVQAVDLADNRGPVQTSSSFTA